MVPKNHHAYGMTLIRMIYNMVSKLGERHPVTLRGNKSTKWHDDTSRNTLIAKSLAPSKIDFPRLIRHLVYCTWGCQNSLPNWNTIVSYSVWTILKSTSSELNHRSYLVINSKHLLLMFTKWVDRKEGKVFQKVRKNDIYRFFILF